MGCEVVWPGPLARSLRRSSSQCGRVRAQPKVRFICECFVPHFVGECGCSESQVYIWWDFLSVSQTDHAMQKRQIECLPIFVAMSDAVCALRAGDEDFYAKEGAEVYDVMTRSKVSHRQADSRFTNMCCKQT